MKKSVLFFAVLLALQPFSAHAEDPQVEIFVTSWCGYCRRLEGFLKKEKIDFVRYDIEKDAEAAEVFAGLNAPGVPVSRIGSTVIRGYDPDRILSAVRGDG